MLTFSKIISSKSKNVVKNNSEYSGTNYSTIFFLSKTFFKKFNWISNDKNYSKLKHAQIPL